MFLNWLNAQDAVEAGSSLADTFVSRQRASETLQEFLRTAARELHSRKLNFYKRARFANAFRWKLLENGVQARLAAEVTQTLLIVSAGDSTPFTEPARSAKPEGTRKSHKSSAHGSRAETLAHEARQAFACGLYAEAIERYTALMDIHPRNVAARNNLAVSLARVGRHAEAKEQYRRAIARQPGFTAPYVNLASLQISQGLFAEAETHLRRALSSNSSELGARALLGQVLRLQGRLDDARNEYEKVLRVAPRHADALCGLGTLNMTEGRFDDSEGFLERAVEADPHHAQAWAAMAQVRRMSCSDKDWLRRAEQTANSLASPVEESGVRFAIGKYFDDVGEYTRAFRSYARANELLKTIAPPYERDARAGFIDNVLRAHSRELIAAAQPGGSTSSRPIFVVGMMRTGTSLVEQILASHPEVGGAGELDFWNSAVLKHQAQIRQGLLSDKMRRKLAEAYLRTLRGKCPGTRYVVDKTPVNSDYLGIIHSVFPRARIIYMRRNPIDTCLSCYFQPFAAALSHCLDLSDLAHYYTEHARLIAHWRKVLPAGTLLEVPYEELVVNQEYWTRRMLDFLGLDWDERCLKFHETQRAVLTASQWQVRQPMYDSSVQRWRNYSKFIGPLLDLKPG